MILFRIFYNKHEVSYFMKLLIFLSMLITSSKPNKVHSSQKYPPKSSSNETLSDQDFEDSVNPSFLSQQNYSIPNSFEKNRLMENGAKFESSTNHDVNALKKTKKGTQSKKHRNIIKMICDSDNLISQMTLHMNFLDNSRDEKHHDFTFKKIFSSNEPKNEVSFSYPEVPETLLSENHSDDAGVKDFQFSASKPYEEDEPLKKDSNINYLLLNEEYDTNQIAKKKKLKAQNYSKDDYKSEIKIFNSGPRVESYKSYRENNAPPTRIKDKKMNNKLKFWVTAVSLTETPQEIIEKNNLLHKLHLSEPSDPLDSFQNNTSESEELNLNLPLSDNDDIIPQVIDNIEETQTSSQDDQDNGFNDKEYDGDNKKDEEVLNYSKKFKKYQLANSKHTVDENENINQSDDTFLYDYPVSYKKQYRNKIFNKDNNHMDKGKLQKKHKAWKSNLISRPKMKSIISVSAAQLSETKNPETMAEKKKKIQQRQKVIENLKFILSKQGNELHKTDYNNLQSKHSSLDKTKEALKVLNISKEIGKKNGTEPSDISDNHTNNLLFLNDDRETGSSSSVEDILFEYQNQKIPIDIYDVDMNDNDVKTKLRNKESFHQANNENSKKYSNQKELHPKFDSLLKKEKRSSNKNDKDKQSSQVSKKIEKHLVKRMVDDRGEEIRKGVFLKKCVPLQFDPRQKTSDLGNKQLLDISDPQRKQKNKQHNSLAENYFKSNELKNSQLKYKNLKVRVKRDTMADHTFQKACSRFLRDIALIKFLNDKYNDESIFVSS